MHVCAVEVWLIPGGVHVTCVCVCVCTCVCVDTLFLEEFGHVPSELFSEFDEVPIAAASLAQVYRARTLAGKEVAVKAQYIDLQDRYEGDISTVRFLLALVAWMHPKFKLGWIFRVSVTMYMSWLHACVHVVTVHDCVIKYWSLWCRTLRVL